MRNAKELKQYAVVEQTSDPTPVKNLTERTDERGLQYIRFDTVLQELCVLNRNNRIYTEGYKGTFTTERMLDLLAKKQFVGEANHPIKPDIDRVKYVDFANVSHFITNLSVNGNIIDGTVETISHGMGIMMRNMILQKMDPAFSARALVFFKEGNNGQKIASTPGFLVAYDWVFYPSFANAVRKPGEKTQIITLDPSTGKESEITLESANSSMFTEPNFIEINSNSDEVKDFISMESASLKNFGNQFDLSSDIRVSHDMKEIYVMENTDVPGEKKTLVLELEDYVRNEVMHGMKNL